MFLQDMSDHPILSWPDKIPSSEAQTSSGYFDNGPLYSYSQAPAFELDLEREEKK